MSMIQIDGQDVGCPSCGADIDLSKGFTATEMSPGKMVGGPFHFRCGSTYRGDERGQPVEVSPCPYKRQSLPQAKEESRG